MTLQMIGRYQVLSELGRGGMATVYRAVDPQVGREVAIKVLPRDLLHDQEFRARFQREAEVLGTLEHPAIVPVYDSGEHQGQPYLVMRLMAGGSLADRLRQGPLGLAEVARIIAALAPALDAAHAAGIVHRDLKPGNILFDQHDQPYLADFGIAKLFHATTQLTVGDSIGTPDYMAPEIARPGGLTPLIDVYALGVTVFQMLTGRTPYQADTPVGVLVAHITEPIPDLGLLCPDLPEAASLLVARALAKNPADRYQSAAGLAADLAALRDAGAVTGATMRIAASALPLPDPQPARSGRAPLSRRLALGAAGLAVFSLGLLLALFVIAPIFDRGGETAGLAASGATVTAPTAPMPAADLAPSPPPQPTLAAADLAPSPSPQPSPAAVGLSTDMLVQLDFQVADAAYSPVLDRIIFTERSPDRLHIYEPLNADDVQIDLFGSPIDLAISPDGKFAAVATPGQILYIDLIHKTTLAMINHETPVDGVAVGSGGRIYLLSRDSGGALLLLLINAATQEESPIPISPAVGGVRYRLLPNGHALYGITDAVPPALERIDTWGSGGVQYGGTFPYTDQYDLGGNLWFSSDSQRIFTACGTVFSASDLRAQDMRYSGSLSDTPWVRSIYHVQASGMLLALPGSQEGDSPGCQGAPAQVGDDYLMIYAYADLAPVSSFNLPPIRIGGSAHTMHGRHVFANDDGSRYYVIVQSDSSALSTQISAVLTINVEGP